MNRFIAIAFGVALLGIAYGCKTLLDTANQNAQAGVCKPAPEVFLNNSHKDICDKNETWTCCGYGFLNAQNNMCFYLLCQPTDDCSKMWEYETITCPPPNPEIQPKNQGTSWDEGNVPI